MGEGDFLRNMNVRWWFLWAVMSFDIGIALSFISCENIYCFSSPKLWNSRAPVTLMQLNFRYPSIKIKNPWTIFIYRTFSTKHLQLLLLNVAVSKTVRETSRLRAAALSFLLFLGGCCFYTLVNIKENHKKCKKDKKKYRKYKKENINRIQIVLG